MVLQHAAEAGADGTFWLCDEYWVQLLRQGTRRQGHGHEVEQAWGALLQLAARFFAPSEALRPYVQARPSLLLFVPGLPHHVTLIELVCDWPLISCQDYHMSLLSLAGLAAAGAPPSHRAAGSRPCSGQRAGRAAVLAGGARAGGAARGRRAAAAAVRAGCGGRAARGAGWRAGGGVHAGRRAHAVRRLDDAGRVPEAHGTKLGAGPSSRLAFS